jgi:hypothetical protein
MQSVDFDNICEDQAPQTKTEKSCPPPGPSVRKSSKYTIKIEAFKDDEEVTHFESSSKFSKEEP